MVEAAAAAAAACLPHFARHKLRNKERSSKERAPRSSRFPRRGGHRALNTQLPGRTFRNNYRRGKTHSSPPPVFFQVSFCPSAEKRRDLRVSTGTTMKTKKSKSLCLAFGRARAGKGAKSALRFSSWCC